jgi:hypothetical protein
MLDESHVTIFIFSQLKYECVEGEDNVYNPDLTFTCTVDIVNTTSIDLQICSGQCVISNLYPYVKLSVHFLISLFARVFISLNSRICMIPLPAPALTLSSSSLCVLCS